MFPSLLSRREEEADTPIDQYYRRQQADGGKYGTFAHRLP